MRIPKKFRYIKIKDDEQEGETPEPQAALQEYSYIEVRVSAFIKVNKNLILWVSERKKVE